MIIDINKFYNTTNWKQFVPLEAFTELTRNVAEVHLKDVAIKNLLSITYSVDDYDENPIYLEYLDYQDQKHLVKIKPAIHEQLDNVLKQYAKLTYVDEKVSQLTTKIEEGNTNTLQQAKDYTDETKSTLTILINGSKEEAINISKQYTDDRETSIRNDLTTNINSALQESKEYTDTKNVETQAGLKNYVDAKHDEALTKIEEGDTNTLNKANEYTDDLKDELNPKIEANKNRLYIKNHNGETNEIETSGHVTFEVNDGIKAIEVQQKDSVELAPERIDFSNLDAGAKILLDPTEPPESLQNTIMGTSENGELLQLTLGDKENNSAILSMWDYAKKDEMPEFNYYEYTLSGMQSLVAGYAGRVKPSSVNCTRGAYFGVNNQKFYPSTIYCSNKSNYTIPFLDIQDTRKFNDDISYHRVMGMDSGSSFTTIDGALITYDSLSNLCTTSNTYTKTEVDNLLATLSSGTPTIFEFVPILSVLGIGQATLVSNQCRILKYGDEINSPQIIFINAEFSIQATAPTTKGSLQCAIDWNTTLPDYYGYYDVTTRLKAGSYYYSETTTSNIQSSVFEAGLPTPPATATQAGTIYLTLIGSILVKNTPSIEE